MSLNNLAQTATRTLRIGLGAAGVLALVVGVLILVWPGKTAMVVAAIFAGYAIVVGVLYAVAGITVKGAGRWVRIGHVVLGAVYVIAGVLTFSNLGLAAASLGVLLGIMVGIMWIIEGIAALTTLKEHRSRVWPIVFAVLSIVAGVLLLLSPLFAVLVLFWLLGITLVIQGVVNIVRAITLKPTGIAVEG